MNQLFKPTRPAGCNPARGSSSRATRARDAAKGTTSPTLPAASVPCVAGESSIDASARCDRWDLLFGAVMARLCEAVALSHADAGAVTAERLLQRLQQTVTECVEALGQLRVMRSPTQEQGESESG